ncbi:SusC/RagA family TonB-linked outer membrane protein [Paraflavisolibacter sp. H34]|uniref:SusC/RagA family TonB-linked outer membrane protein n=1 Tax=Huijunlia imazamoxiresistens TaxID=3127457 RepID=UPI0030196B1F
MSFKPLRFRPVILAPFFLFPLLQPHTATAQEAGSIVKGFVHSDNNRPLSGVSVIIRNSKTNFTTGTTTDSTGVFTFSRVPAGGAYSFSFSMVDYEPQTMSGYTIKGATTLSLDVELKAVTRSMNEVVVIGYGTTSRKNLTTSVAKVDPKTVPQAANNSVAQLLFGRAAGMTAAQNSAEPGGAISVSIRGRGNPLVVVDGVILPFSGLEPGSGNRSMDANVSRGGFAGINPNDIESIEFLKDASASIYGVNAANGVMLITTKKGKGGRANVSYEGSRSLVKNREYFEPLTASGYMTYYNQLTLDKFLLDKKMAPFGPNPADLTEYNNGTSKPYTQEQIKNAGRGTDWLSYVLKDGSIDNHNVSISGSSDKVNYYFSGGFFDQKGTIENSGLRRYTGRMNLTFNLTKFLSLNANVNAGRNNYLNSQSGGQGGGAGQQGFGALQAALAYPATLPVYDPATGKYSQFRMTGNPLSLLNIRDKTTNSSLFTSFAADFKIIPNMLSARLLYGNNTETADRDFFIPSSTFFDQLNRSRGSVTNSKRQNQTIEATVNFKKKFGEVVSIDAVAGTGQYPNDYYSFSASGADMLDAIGTDALGSSSLSSQTVFSQRSADKLRSYFSRASFDFLDRYILSLSVRHDGYSQFFPQNKYASFPAASLAWKVTNERFLQKLKFLNFLKVRASVGVTGNASGFAYGSFSPEYSIVTFNNGGTAYTPYYLTALDNPNLRWPKTINKNIGLDFGLLNDRINGSFDLFRDDLTRFVVYQTTSQLSLIPTAPINTGHQVRKGWELNLNTNNVKSGNFQWTSLINLTHNNLRWKDRYANTNLNSWQSETDLVSSYYVFKTDGILKAGQTAPAWQPAAGNVPGFPTFADRNGDKKLDTNDVVRIDPAVKLAIGFGNTFRYKHFDLAVLFYGQFGGLGTNPNALWSSPVDFLAGLQSGIKQLSEVWTTSNPNGTRPGVAYNEGALGLRTGTDIGLLKTDFVRCRNITLGYNISSGTFTKYVRNLRVYADAQNPFLFTKYPISDPELTAPTVKGGPAPYPMARVFSLGVRTNF